VEEVGDSEVNVDWDGGGAPYVEDGRVWALEEEPEGSDDWCKCWLWSSLGVGTSPLSSSSSSTVSVSCLPSERPLTRRGTSLGLDFSFSGDGGPRESLLELAPDKYEEKVVREPLGKDGYNGIGSKDERKVRSAILEE
jgi:hypothetical protein